MEIGKIYRYARPYNYNPERIDGYLNYFFATHSLNQQSMPTLDKGINSIKAIDAPEGKRIPAILISSSPHPHGKIYLTLIMELLGILGIIKAMIVNQVKCRGIKHF